MTTETMTELGRAIDRITQGVRDPKAGEKALKDLESIREETKRRVGIVDVALSLIRDARDQ